MNIMPKINRRSANISTLKASRSERNDQYDSMVLPRKSRLFTANKSSAQCEILFFGANCITVITVMQTPTIVEETGKICREISLFLVSANAKYSPIKLYLTTNIPSAPFVRAAYFPPHPTPLSVDHQSLPQPPLLHDAQVSNA